MKFRNLTTLDSRLANGLVVSCQPVDDGPMDRDDIVVALAHAAVIGGANAVRIEGAKRVALVGAVIDAPIIGIVKRDLADSHVRITPWLQDVHDLVHAGADIVAVDGTARASGCTHRPTDRHPCRWRAGDGRLQHRRRCDGCTRDGL